MSYWFFARKTTGCLVFAIFLCNVSFAQSRNSNAAPIHDAVVDTIKGLDETRLPSALRLSDTSFSGNEKVAIDVTVDSLGNVVNAAFQSVGSTTNRKELIKLALKSAYRLKFSRSSSASKGTIIFHLRIFGNN